MLKDLTPDQRALAKYMSDVSEEAYCAGWMLDLELALWELVEGHRSSYGLIALTETQRITLRTLSERCGGWIVFDDDLEETWLPLDNWRRVYSARLAARCRPPL